MDNFASVEAIAAAGSNELQAVEGIGKNLPTELGRPQRCNYGVY